MNSTASPYLSYFIQHGSIALLSHGWGGGGVDRNASIFSAIVGLPERDVQRPLARADAFYTIVFFDQRGTQQVRTR
jgi:pimeloyl-ACP methyl ester carboxylesterase